ncbi:MAG: PhnD/SsuA/transferrin family substrate-binding protein [Thermodesulfovibrionia bacterium]|nr:PhnD/SsuA/transferrin family substrate-binding protein [Thermodesulfovibrionia bacterium]
MPLNFKKAVAIFSFLFILSGCVKDEKPKKVSLYKKSEAVSKEDNELTETLSFGFNLSLDPKEQVQIYTPFLKYLEWRTGKRFRLKFSKTHEENVRELGLGAVDFAAIDLMNYVTGKEKYGIRYLVSGLNKDGEAIYHTAIITRPEGKIQIIGLPAPYPGSIIAYNSAVDSKTVELVKAALLEFEPNGRHKHIIFEWDKTEMPNGFGTADISDLDNISTLIKKYGLNK